MKSLRTLLYALLCLSLIPALILGWNRIQFERAQQVTVLTMDMPTLHDQALALGKTDDELLSEYRKRGVNGLAIYEDMVKDRIDRGELMMVGGYALMALHPEAKLRPNWAYYRSLKPGSAEDLVTRYTLKSEKAEVAGQTWYGFPVDLASYPAGPNLEEINRRKSEGWVVSYRPWNHPAVIRPEQYLPDVPILIFNGLNLYNYDHPENQEPYLEAIRKSGAAVGLIEFTEQKGLSDMARVLPAVRVFSLSRDYQATLDPEEFGSKVVLGARERYMQVLYVRPFNTIEDTNLMIDKVMKGLELASIRLGQPTPEDYHPSTLLRALSCVGPLVALLLVVMSYPLQWLGRLAGLGTLGLAVVVAGPNLMAFSLLAAMVFPALGFLLYRKTPWDWLRATLISFMGVFFLTAIGTTRGGMLGLDPFEGVSLTLLMPVALYLGSLFPDQDIRKTLSDLYNTKIQAGDLVVAGIGLVVIALVVLRRGNATGASVSEAEAALREFLQNGMVRPRFKDIMGHPAAILGLSGHFPPYITIAFMTVGVIGQASLVNTFEHFHTPLLISLLRAVNGVAFGAVVGFVLLPIVRWLVNWFKQYRVVRA
ncbi:DUF5693 family protein [Deinococcus cellulosilyticus]|uniref:Uncharacterized protein n=1 Tax=Deinococcus cellulosilyticus (strain DSM 18568 / NBRC 106333 / KACC 11606 / 5516J-15) TaxID=1223518 RepID=A0A511MZR6_DEIC1|nr:DUF5693 family protein [Deinococcus cellulosilyticus]GEM45738.1 hypothetical protein DC3_13730 [Deinococcus cellulosilyticus NBRC 106333 = KACC 11606]